MSAASLALWTILAGGDVSDRETLPVGLHPAGVLLAAYHGVDGTPLLIEDETLANRHVWVHVPLRVRESSRFSLTVLLRSAGIHLIPWQNLGSDPFLYVSTSPRGAPSLGTEMKFAVLDLRYLSPKIAAEVLSEIAEKEERDDKTRTRFIPSEKASRLVVRYRKPERLERYRQMLRTLDVRPGPLEDQRPALRSRLARMATGWLGTR